MTFLLISQIPWQFHWFSDELPLIIVTPLYSGKIHESYCISCRLKEI